MVLWVVCEAKIVTEGLCLDEGAPLVCDHGLALLFFHDFEDDISVLIEEVECLLSFCFGVEDNGIKCLVEGFLHCFGVCGRLRCVGVDAWEWVFNVDFVWCFILLQLFRLQLCCFNSEVV